MNANHSTIRDTRRRHCCTSAEPCARTVSFDWPKTSLEVAKVTTMPCDAPLKVGT
eukprot:CAMPEP_0204083728 /NCGR_PEP_ID=MMETSP0360-20130528/178998_1 /ASSEMBLY_ACC=CAM_ASM_000342 /TAXON_ID=268821 /ORGANISM="Scrippsiella Hangoei, Strain SHTV-5" /LENGTH=54 /DNA_ID=CAMNT_0051032675 /DNA_START=112 /DNA_END=276 /DNA_ORIENTATION=-